MEERDKDNSFDVFLKEKFPENHYENVNGNFKKYIEKSGVWVCYGLKNEEPSEWVCLNVGSSKNIGIEMRTNLDYSQGNFAHKKGIYKNFMGEKIFEFIRPKNEPITIRERVWKHIGENYKDLHFIVILISKDEDERLKTEMAFAEKNEAVYWNYSPKQRKMKAEGTN